MKLDPKFARNFEADEADYSNIRINSNTMIHMTRTTHPDAWRTCTIRPYPSTAIGPALVLLIF